MGCGLSINISYDVWTKGRVLRPPGRALLGPVPLRVALLHRLGDLVVRLHHLPGRVQVEHRDPVQGQAEAGREGGAAGLQPAPDLVLELPAPGG